MRKLTVLAIGLTLGLSAFAQTRKVIQPKEFAPGKPFSPGILVDRTLYIAGQTGQDPKTGNIPGEFEAEVKAALENVRLILTEAGMKFEDVVAVQVCLTDMDLFQRMNAVYTTYFKAPPPARTTLGVAKLVGTAKIEITVTAHK